MGAEENPKEYELDKGEAYNPGEQIMDLEAATNQARQELLSLEEFIDRINRLESAGAAQITRDLHEKLLRTASNLEQSLEEWQNLSNALSVSNEKLPEEIENLNPRDKKKLHTTETPDPSYQENIKYLDEETQETMATIAEILGDAEYPYFIFGSSSHILELGSKTQRKPKDTDAACAVQDFAQAFAKAKQMESSGRIRNVALEEMRNLDGRRNDCFELQAEMQAGNGKTKPISIFFQRIDGNLNSRVNVGAEETKIVTVNIKGVEANIAHKETNELMYGRSALLELSLYNLADRQSMLGRFPYVESKVLKRIIDLMISNDFNYEKVVEIISSSADTKYVDEKTIAAVQIYEKLKDDFEKMNQSGDGLVKQICAANQEVIKNCEEYAIDKIAQEAEEDMNASADLYTESEKIMQETVSARDKLELIQEIDKKIQVLYHKYANYKEQLNNKDKADFAAFVAIYSAKYNFMYKITLDLDIKKKQLLEQITQ